MMPFIQGERLGVFDVTEAAACVPCAKSLPAAALTPEDVGVTTETQ